MQNPVKKRVLIVDDAVVVRKTLTDLIARDPALEVVGTAANGRIALAKFSSLRPDIVLLDIEMPEMTGLEALPELRKLAPRVPIIVFSTLTERGAEATLDALSLGATDYITKPSNSDMGSTAESVSRELIPKIKVLCGLRDSSVMPPGPSAPTVPAVPVIRPPRIARPLLRVQVVAIGVSTGGPDALAVVLPALPADFSLPVVIAQHMPPLFTALLASRLTAKCALPVRECQPGQPLEPGCMWIAPGDRHMVVKEENGVAKLHTHQGPKENFCRPSVDVLFRSVAQVYGGRCLAVVLTGMGQDGLKGCEALYARGARIMVQDEATSVVWGMPGFVARSGLADKVLPLDKIGPEIVGVAANQLAAHP